MSIMWKTSTKLAGLSTHEKTLKCENCKKDFTELAALKMHEIILAE